jgi:hypothetical protein
MQYPAYNREDELPGFAPLKAGAIDLSTDVNALGNNNKSTKRYKVVEDQHIISVNSNTLNDSDPNGERKSRIAEKPESTKVYSEDYNLSPAQIDGLKEVSSLIENMSETLLPNVCDSPDRTEMKNKYSGVQSKNVCLEECKNSDQEEKIDTNHKSIEGLPNMNMYYYQEYTKYKETEAVDELIRNDDGVLVTPLNLDRLKSSDESLSSDELKPTLACVANIKEIGLGNNLLHKVLNSVRKNPDKKALRGRKRSRRDLG